MGEEAAEGGEEGRVTVEGSAREGVGMEEEFDTKRWMGMSRVLIILLLL